MGLLTQQAITGGVILVGIEKSQDLHYSVLC